MAIKLLKVGNSFNVPQKQYICDTEDERDALKAYFGDLCLVIETGLTYILNSENEWMDYPTGGGGGGVDTSLIAADFSEESPYDQNDLAIYEGMLYRATANVEAGPFDETKWAETNLAAEIEARGGAAAVHPDWNENNPQSPNYIQNRTHYMNTVTDLVDPTWDGDPESENAPEITELTAIEQNKIRYAGLYKLTDSLDTDLDCDNVVLQWHAEADLGGGNVIEVDYNGIFTEVMYSFASEYYAMFGVSSAQEAYQALMQMTWRSSQSSDRTWPFRTQEGYEIQDDSIVTSQLVCGESFANYILVQVNQAGTYQVKNEGTSQEVTLTTGWYAIQMKIGGDGMYFTSTPLVYSTVVPLDYKYMPEISIQKYENLSEQVGKITPLDVEIHLDEFEDFEPGYYNAGDVIFHNYIQYMAINSGYKEEFNENDWGNIAASSGVYFVRPYNRSMTNKILTYEDFQEAITLGRPLRLYYLGMVPQEFNYSKITQTSGQYTSYSLRICHRDGEAWDFEISELFNEDNSHTRNSTKLPYIKASSYDVSPYLLYPENYGETTTYVQLLKTFLEDRRLLSTKSGNSLYQSLSRGQSLVISASSKEETNPWIIVLEDKYLYKYTFNSSTGAHTKQILLNLNGSTDGQLLKYNSNSGFTADNLIHTNSTAPTDTQKIWVDNSTSPSIVKIYDGTAWRAIETPNVMFCELTESNNVYTCDTEPYIIHKAFHAGTQVYINYMGVLIPVTNTAYDSQERKYYINATLTTVVGEELLGRRIAFDGTDWSVDFNDSFIVRGAGSLSNIGKYLKATATGVEWDTPAGGGSAEALSTEEMLELFAEKELISSPGLGYYEFTADPNGDYVYDSELREYRLAREGETGEYSATISLVGCVENSTTYVLVF